MLWLLGICISICACFFTTYGILVMKWSADHEKDKPLLMRYRWMVGFAVNVGAEIGLTSIAMSLTPLSMLAPVAGLQIVFTALIAHFGLVPGVHEKLALIDWCSMLLTFSGVVLVSFSGPQSDAIPNGKASQVAFCRPRFVTFMLSSVLLVFGWLGVWKTPLRWGCRPSADSLITSYLAGTTAGACGAFSQLFFKIVMVGIRTLLHGNREPIYNWITWVAAAGLIICAPLQMYLLNMTLASGAATITVSIYTIAMIIVTIFAGALLFEEFEGLRLERIGIFCIAVTLVVVGLVILTKRTQGQRDDVDRIKGELKARAYSSDKPAKQQLLEEALQGTPLLPGAGGQHRRMPSDGSDVLKPYIARGQPNDGETGRTFTHSP